MKSTKQFRYFLPCLLLLISSSGIAQSEGKRIKGPVIKDFGAVFKIDNTDFQTNTSQEYKVVFDIHSSPENPARLNPAINTLARFLNMHAQAGVPLENLKVAGVFHNKASKDALNNETYKAKYGVDNPNAPLLKALDEAGVSLLMCGQSIYARGMERDQIADPIQVGLSAMTIILTLEEEGYKLIKF